MDKRGIRETELWGAALWVALIVFVALEGAWLKPWTWQWAVGVLVWLGFCWLCMAQYGAAKRRAKARPKEAVWRKLLALTPEQRSDLNALARRGEMCLSGDDAEEQIEAALRRRIWPSCAIAVVAGLLVAGCGSVPEHGEFRPALDDGLRLDLRARAERVGREGLTELELGLVDYMCEEEGLEADYCPRQDPAPGELAADPQPETFRPILPAGIEAYIIEKAATQGRDGLSEQELLVVDSACRDGRAPAAACG